MTKITLKCERSQPDCEYCDTDYIVLIDGEDSGLCLDISTQYSKVQSYGMSIHFNDSYVSVDFPEVDGADPLEGLLLKDFKKRSCMPLKFSYYFFL